MLQQFGFDYTIKRNQETLGRLQAGLGMTPVEASKLKTFIATEMERESLKYAKFTDLATKAKAEAVRTTVRNHLGAKLFGVSNEWVDHAIWCVLKNINVDKKRRADAPPEVQIGDAKKRKKRLDESSIQSSRKDPSKREPH